MAARLALVALLTFAPPASAVTVDWVTVGNPGNLCDRGRCAGGVDQAYRIAKYEVANAQYVEFLNAVADSDPNGLYNTNMSQSAAGGIERSGSAGSFSYSAMPGREAWPVTYVSFYDALRFANWLHNGQPTGAQDGTSTEDGAYTITAQGVSDNSITRNAGATIFLPTEDEWYKAAYHNAVGLSRDDYFEYPAGSNTEITCADPTATPNRANCGLAMSHPADVGSYPGSASPYGTFDQGGNVYEWNETVFVGSSRGFRGGSYRSPVEALAASTGGSTDPLNENDFGFRVAAVVPEPGTGLLLLTGLAGLAWRRRLR